MGFLGIFRDDKNIFDDPRTRKGSIDARIPNEFLFPKIIIKIIIILPQINYCI